jgi:hypothetical protein
MNINEFLLNHYCEQTLNRLAMKNSTDNLKAVTKEDLKKAAELKKKKRFIGVVSVRSLGNVQDFRTI